MAFAPPQELTELLSTDDRVSAERAWRTFLERHSRYLLSAARCFTVDYDGSMDRYRFILEELQREDYKRLRTYSADPSSRFSTWLVVVARRLCYDYHRKLYGRDRSTDPATRETRAVRRRRWPGASARARAGPKPRIRGAGGLGLASLGLALRA